MKDDILLAPSHVAKGARLVAKTDDVVAFKSDKVEHLKGEHGDIALRKGRPIFSTRQVENLRGLTVKAFD